MTDHKAEFTKAVRTGILKLQQKGLSTLPQSVFEIEKFVPEENVWWELLVPHTLILTHNQLTDLSAPHDLDWETGWKELQTLNVAHNKITEIPVDILRLEFVRKLQCQHNRICHISFGRGLGSNLVHVELQNNELQSLGEDIGECVHLQHLNVSFNRLRSLPLSLFESCSKLQVLEATNNQIAGPLLNINFSKCLRLRECDLSMNRITAISTSMFSMPSLHRLSLRQNQIAVIVVEGGTQNENDNEQKQEFKVMESHLIELYLGSNRLSQCPCNGIVSFPSLKLLDLSCNRLEAVSAEIVDFCPVLHRLDISGNDLQDIPAELSLLENLESIVATGNPLRRIKRSLIGNTTSLKLYLRNRLKSKTENEDTPHSNPLRDSMMHSDPLRCTTLQLKDHSLKSLPPNMGQMVNLCHLELDQNQISNIDALRCCISLKHLTATKNHIADLSPLFGLCELEVVDLRVNRLKTLTGFGLTDDKSHGIWPKLQSLRLGFNAISDPSPLLQCIVSPNVRVLDFGQNNLSVFPEAILKWKALEVLDLSNNDLSDIPNALGLMESLNAVMLSGVAQEPIVSVLRLFVVAQQWW